MTIGLFGARGMLGRAIASEFDSRGIEYIPILRGTDYLELPAFDFLINAAGNSKKYLANKDPVEDFENNVSSLVKLLHSVACRKARIVHLSSSEVYGEMDPTKALLTEVSSLQPNSNYGFSKVLAEEVVKNYSESWIILRLGGQYGNWMSKGPIFDILNNKPLHLTPDSTLQLLNTRETTLHILDLIERVQDNQIFNLASPEILSVSQIGSLLGKELAFADELSEYHSCLSVEKISKLITIGSQTSGLQSFKSRDFAS